MRRKRPPLRLTNVHTKRYITEQSSFSGDAVGSGAAMKLGLLSEREVVPVVAPTKRSSPFESALRRWLSRNTPAQQTELEDVAEEVFIRLSRYSDDTLV